MTVPPAPAFRSSHKPAIRGGPFRWASVVSENAPSARPNVMLPLALTNSDAKRCPQKSIGKSREQLDEAIVTHRQRFARLAAR